MRRLKKILLWTGVSLVSLILLMFLAVFIFEDDIKEYAVKYLNARLDTKVHVDDIELSFFSKFPYATLDFKNVRVEESYGSYRTKQTLFSAEHLYFEFSIWDVFDGQYDIKKIEAENGSLNIKIDSLSNGNYQVLKPSQGGDDENFDLKLEDVIFEDFIFNYTSAPANQEYRFYTSKTKCNGKFFNEEFLVSGNADLTVKKFRSNNLLLMQNRGVRLDLKLKVNTKTANYSIQKGGLVIDGLPFDIQGVVSDSAQTYCDLAVKGDGLALNALINILPEVYQNELADHKGKGALDFSTSIKGKVGGGNTPLLQANFELQNGSITNEKEKIHLTELTLIGSYTNKNQDEKSEFQCAQLSGKFEDGFFKGELRLEGLENPLLETQFESDLNLATLYQFLQFEEVRQMTGQSHVNAKVLGRITENGFELKESSGTCKLSNASLEVTRYPKPFEQINGEIQLHHQNLKANNFQFANAGSEFNGDAVVYRVLDYLFGKASDLKMEVNLGIDQLNMNTFAGTADQQAANHPEDYSPIPKGINAKIKLAIDKFQVEEMNAENLKTILSFNKGEVQCKYVNFEGFGGEVKARFSVNKNLVLTGDATLQDVQIDETFRAFNSFGQSIVTSQNIKGRVDAQSHFQIQLDQEMEPDLKSIVATADVHVRNGILKNVKALTEITDYMRESKMMDVFFKKHINDLERRLKMIRFEDITNQIVVKDQVVKIPEMTIKSNVMDLNLSGSHTFKNHIDYAFDFMFKELKIQEAEYTEFGHVMDDGTGMRLFVSMTGTVDDPVITLNKEDRKKHFREEIKQEKETFKSMLKKDLGLFKNDTTVKEYEEKETPKVEFEIETEEPEEKPSSAKATEDKKKEKEEPTSEERVKEKDQDNKKKRSKFFEKWLKNEEKEEQEEFIIEGGG